jgi:hypothetical protein
MVNPRLTLSAVLRQRYACALPAAAQITLNAVEETEPIPQQESWYRYICTSNVFTTSTPGSYTFTVTDTSGNSCTSSTTTAMLFTTL